MKKNKFVTFKILFTIPCLVTMLFMLSISAKAWPAYNDDNTTPTKNGEDGAILYIQSSLDNPTPMHAKLYIKMPKIVEYTGENVLIQTTCDDNEAENLPYSYRYDGTANGQTKEVGEHTVEVLCNNSYEPMTFADETPLKFIFNIVYSLTLDSNDDRNLTEKVLEIGSVNIPDAPFLAPSGMKFDGWAYDKEGNNRVNDASLVLSENTTIYAVWVKDDNGGNQTPVPPAPEPESPKTLNDITFEKLMAAYKDINSQIVEVDFGEEEGNLERNVMSLLKESNDVLHVTYKLGGVTYSFYITPDMVELEEGLQIFGPKKLLFYNQTEKKLQATKYIAANIKEAAANSIQGGDVYIVKKGDNLSSIASRYNLTVNDIVKVNIIPNANLITPGMQLTIEYPWIDKSQII